MKDDRFRVPVEDDYVAAIGRAAYIFAGLEWNAVWCCDCLRAGYVNTVTRKAAGNIACDLLCEFKNSTRITDPVLCTECINAGTEFKRLVKVRNDLLHAKPGTAPGLGRDQRLFRNG